MKARELRRPLGIVLFILGVLGIAFGIYSLRLNPGEAWTTIVLGVVAVILAAVSLLLARNDRRRSL